MSLSGCTRQDFHLDGSLAGPQPLGVHRNGTFPPVCPTALPSGPSLLSSRFTLHPLSFVYLLPHPHLTRATRFCVVHYHIRHLPSSTKRLVSLCGRAGPLMAEHRLHVVGAEPNTPAIRAKDLPSPGAFSVSKGLFLPCYSSFMAAVHRAAEHAGVSVANMLTGCFAGPGPSPRNYHYSLCPYMY